MSLTAADLKKLSTKELVDMYNKSNPGSTIKKFSDRSTAVKRVLALNISASEKPAKASKPKKEKKAGVIATFKDFCMGEGRSIEEILDHLAAYFPDKKKSSMKNTIHANFRPKNVSKWGMKLNKTKSEKGIIYKLSAL